MLALCQVTAVITTTVCKESDACYTGASAFEDTDFDVFEARLNSDTIHMTDVEVKAMQAGFKPNEVKTRVGEVTQTFRQRSLRNETKKYGY